MIAIKKLGQDQRGLVSIVVTMIIISVMTLIAIGFAGLASREQRQAIDQQLSSQAFYAAESGINDTIKNPSQATECTTPKPLSIDTSVSVTCLIVDDQPTSLEYSDVNGEGSTVVPIEPSASLAKLTIGWQDKLGNNSYATGCTASLTPFGQWSSNGRPGMLRIMLIPQSFSSRDDLIDRTLSKLLYPSVESAAPECNDSVSYPSSSGGYLYGDCQESRNKQCQVSINFSSPSNAKYMLRLKGIYRSSAVTISGVDPSGNAVKFLNAQRQIDSTGKTTDVLRRLKVSVPISSGLATGGIFPEYTVETADTLCKQLLVGPGFATTGTDPACSLQ